MSKGRNFIITFEKHMHKISNSMPSIEVMFETICINSTLKLVTNQSERIHGSIHVCTIHPWTYIIPSP